MRNEWWINDCQGKSEADLPPILQLQSATREVPREIFRFSARLTRVEETVLIVDFWRTCFPHAPTFSGLFVTYTIGALYFHWAARLESASRRKGRGAVGREHVGNRKPFDSVEPWTTVPPLQPLRNLLNALPSYFSLTYSLRPRCYRCQRRCLSFQPPLLASPKPPLTANFLHPWV